MFVDRRNKLQEGLTSAFKRIGDKWAKAKKRERSNSETSSTTPQELYVPRSVQRNTKQAKHNAHAVQNMRNKLAHEKKSTVETSKPKKADVKRVRTRPRQEFTDMPTIDWFGPQKKDVMVQVVNTAHMSDKQIRNVFERVGIIRRLAPNCYHDITLVVYDTIGHARRAISTLNKTMCGGRMLHVMPSSQDIFYHNLPCVNFLPDLNDSEYEHYDHEDAHSETFSPASRSSPSGSSSDSDSEWSSQNKRHKK